MTATPKIQLPEAERGLSDAQVRRFDKLTRKLALPTLKPSQRDAAVDELAALAAAPKTAADAAWRARALAETVTLAAERGEDVHQPKQGPVRVNNRDTLLPLRHRLTPAQYETALELRACYDARSGDLGSQLGQESAGGGHNNDQFVYARLLRARRLQWLGRAERAIALQCITQPGALQMVRAVLGQGVSLSAFGRGRAFDRNLGNFVAGLDVARLTHERAPPKS